MSYVYYRTGFTVIIQLLEYFFPFESEVIIMIFLAFRP